MHYVGISIYISVHFVLSAMPAYTHKHMHTRILIPFEDSELTGLIVGITEC